MDYSITDGIYGLIKHGLTGGKHWVNFI